MQGNLSDNSINDGASNVALDVEKIADKVEQVNNVESSAKDAKKLPANAYHFVTHWRIFGTKDEILEILRDPTDLPRWWKSVYLEAIQTEPGNDDGIGKKISLLTKGFLPYRLRWNFTITSVGIEGYSLEAIGDFNGRGLWTFVQDGDWVNVTYDWNITAEKPLLKRLTPILRPIFSWNHRWAMARGAESLQLEINRRRAKTDHERKLIPPPPSGTPTSAVPLLAGTLAIGFITTQLFRFLFNRRNKKKPIEHNEQ